MHTNKPTLTDTILSHQGVASFIFSNALDQVAKLAKVSQKEALALLVTEVKMSSQDTSTAIDNIYYRPIIEHIEQKYIYSLFK